MGECHSRRRRRIRHRCRHAPPRRRPYQVSRYFSKKIHTKRAHKFHRILFEFDFDMVFAVNDGRVSNLPSYKNTAHAIFTIARLEVCRLYALLLCLHHLIHSVLQWISTFSLFQFSNHAYLVSNHLYVCVIF